MLRYAITDSKRFGDTFEARRSGLLEQARRWFEQQVDYMQLREKDLDAGQLLALAIEIVAMRNEASSRAKLLINSRVDVAVAANADGVHLTSHPDELTPMQVRQIYTLARIPSPFVSVSCHTVDDVRRARDEQADAILFGPVFEKRVDGELVSEGLGLDALKKAVEAAGSIPVFALGGVTAANIQHCLAHGAAGIAAIRLFQ